MVVRAILAGLAMSSLIVALPADLSERENACIALNNCPGTETCPRGAVNNPRCGIFEWGSIGDSWCSGVSYSSKVEYDNNADGCLRVKHAWSAQLENDKSWTKGVQKSAFKGCSGSQLGDMHGYGKVGKNLISQTGTPKVVFMSAGGNNARFGDIVKACIYTPFPFTYGAPYDKDPDCTGLCCQALRDAQDYIDNRDGGLAKDLKNTIADLFSTDQAKSHDQFWLYITGYAHFFNVDTSGPNTCDDWRFAPKYAHLWAPKITQVLRKRMNDVLQAFNVVYQEVINQYEAPNGMHVGYVSITQGFNGHRFCEAGTTLADQWATGTWVWNLTTKRDQDDPNASDTSDISEADGEIIAQAISSDGSANGGSLSRPFHPTEAGHTAIKDSILAKLRADGVPGVTSG